MSDETAKPPRFPYVAALLCAACVGTAGYLWMRYSYCWDTNMPELIAALPCDIRKYSEDGGVPNVPPWDVRAFEREFTGWPAESYVRVFPHHGRSTPRVGAEGAIAHGTPLVRVMDVWRESTSREFMRYEETRDGLTFMTDEPRDLPGSIRTGRVRVSAREQLVSYPVPKAGPDPSLYDEDNGERSEVSVRIDTAAGRWMPQTVAGLVVGAMGVFVFTVALRHWLNRRRAFRVGTAEGDT